MTVKVYSLVNLNIQNLVSAFIRSRRQIKILLLLLETK